MCRLKLWARDGVSDATKNLRLSLRQPPYSIEANTSCCRSLGRCQSESSNHDGYASSDGGGGDSPWSNDQQLHYPSHVHMDPGDVLLLLPGSVTQLEDIIRSCEVASGPGYKEMLLQAFSDNSDTLSRFCMVDPHELEGLEGSEPDYHPEELEEHQGETMEMFIVPPYPPRTGQGRQKRARGKRAASRGRKPASSGGSAQQQHTAAAQQQHTAAQQQPTSSSSNSRLKSKVWKDFTKISNDGDEIIIAKCNHCSAELSGHSQHGTSHLLRHTKAKHMTDQSTMNNFFLKSETNEDGTTALKNVRYDVHTAIIEATAGINSYMGPMLSVLREKFMKYWSDYSVFLSCAAVLDPRIKFKFLAYSYSKLYVEDDALRRIADVRSTLTALFNEYGSGVPIHENLAAAGSSSTCGLGAFSDYDQYVASTSSHEEKSELELYLAEPVKKLNDNIDILDYWSKSAARYPQLARLARDILAIPVSSVASESAFSLSKKVITPNRASLKPKTVEALMCLQDWYRVKLQKQQDNKRKAEVVELDDDGDSTSDEE